MKFKAALNEKGVPITGKTRIGKKYQNYRGITYLVLGEDEPPDVHGIPPEMEAYGRGWVDKKSQSIEIDGGPNGSSQGHPPTAVNGFYWAADQDKIWTGKDGEKRKGVIYIRGRAGTSEQWLEKNALYILELIFKRIPK